jgi:hypothetical protein
VSARPSHAQLVARGRCAHTGECQWNDPAKPDNRHHMFVCPLRSKFGRGCGKWACWSFGGAPDPRCDRCVALDTQREERRAWSKRRRDNQRLEAAP